MGTWVPMSLTCVAQTSDLTNVQAFGQNNRFDRYGISGMQLNAVIELTESLRTKQQQQNIKTNMRYFYKGF